ncbi:hypothetical protein OTB20_19525 [Streptomyces sp. H27-H1]|uniref:hypothetical protein n=1 Tax=Streptomyces sp. H27-H1 TaxID=2996461 RepID=UPI00226ED2D9|nr:hypothetical protein [Streptomyces sp. H27-H1]MCY0928348.1 hypothetical protein [Streptomyces sp. H27-H1]
MSPTELDDLPVEVHRLIHAVDRMRDDWAESNAERRAELWTGVHDACDAVWNRPSAAEQQRARATAEEASLVPPSERRAQLLGEISVTLETCLRDMGHGAAADEIVGLLCGMATEGAGA